MQGELEITILIEVLENLRDQKKKVEVPIEQDAVTRPKIQKPHTFEDFLDLKEIKETKPQAKKQRKNNKGIIVTIDNFLIPTVTYIQALPFNKLPQEYLTGDLPRVWQDGDRLFAGDGFILLEKGRNYSRRILANALQYIELAGEHLAKVKRGRDKRWYNSHTTTFKDGKLKSYTPKK